MLLRKPFSYSFKKITLLIILLNIFSYLICYKVRSYNLTALGSLNYICVVHYKMYWQFFTYMFVHGNFNHIFFNMLGLLMFGLPLERAIGSKEFTLFYFICGLLSGAFSFAVYALTGQYYVFLLGASGALYGVLFAYAVFFPKSIIYIWGIVPVPAPILVLIYAIIEMGSQFLGRGQGIAHLAHLFGFFAAWLYFVIRMGIHPIKIWKNEYRK